MTVTIFGSDTCIRSGSGPWSCWSGCTKHPKGVKRASARCRTGCPTKNHRSYAECARSVSITTGEVYARDNSWNKELDAYDNAVASGINPAGTTMAEVDKAVRISEATGVAYDAEKPWQ